MPPSRHNRVSKERKLFHLLILLEFQFLARMVRLVSINPGFNQFPGIFNRLLLPGAMVRAAADAITIMAGSIVALGIAAADAAIGVVCGDQGHGLVA